MEDILFKLLLLDGNETSFLSEKEYENYKTLVIAVVEVIADIIEKGCPCHPETTIKGILSQETIVKFLNDYASGVVEQLEDWCKNYESKVSNKIFND